uniref:Leishmanolysin-like peptidase n=1 Tax=Parasteatoda tepidariorum TaxID=114398 RepID=A0A2L2YM73_PARTP
MCRYFTAYSCLIIFTNCWIFVNMFTYNCIHDDITLHNKTPGYFNYKKLRKKRESNEILFEPLSIYFHIDDVGKVLPSDVYFYIDVALYRVAQFLSKTIKVKHSMNPFVLERTSCSQIWREGLNKGKCSRMRSRPEFCSSKDTDFMIPDKYLDKLEIYNNIDSDPVSIISKGSGVKNKNLIIFVVSKTTSWCQNTHVQAYGTYCRLDESNRPVAGLLNLCPENLSKSLYKFDHYLNIITHEMFHILGFSKHLYPKFKTCSSRFDCQVPKQIVSIDKFGIQRLIFPEVVEHMQLHFNCSDSEFGGPLENMPAEGFQNEYTSHWHPLLMYSSIMTPSIQQDDYVVIDNITLALLASTGWYEIDFSRAQAFIFGKGGGCNFGFAQKCNDSKYLCDSSHQTGCDIALKTIGKCEKISSDHPCGVYKPNHKESCIEDGGEKLRTDLDLLDYNQQCVVLQQKNGFVPKCVALNCKTSSSLNLLFNGTMVDCDYSNKTLTNVSLNCPADLSFCITEGIEVANTFCEFSKDKLAVSLQIFFITPSAYDLSNISISKQFEIQTVQTIASKIGVPVSYITSSSLHVYKSVYLEFTVCPPRDANETALELIVTKMQEFLKNSTFATIFKDNADLPVAATDISVNSRSDEGISDYEGFQALIIVPITCGIFALATLIASLMRYVIMQSYRPKRQTIERQELNEISPIST